MFNVANSSSLQQINTVLFDMDGTLLDLHFDTYIWMHLVPHMWAEQHQLSIAAAKTYLFQFYVKHQATLEWYSSKFWASKLGIDVLDLQKQQQHLISARPQCFHLLEHLKQLNIECWLVTNADLATLSLKLEKINLGPYFKQIISSELLGAPKEDQLFWNRLNQHYPFEPRKCCLVDDNYQVLDSAKQYGIAHLFSISQPDTQTARQHFHPEYIHLDHLTELIAYLENFTHKLK